ncbi:hypothetical protein FOMG_13180 [Fusarium oxysporum f. sp. melonis 26406]|uniref:Insecticide toxin TcdB middle/N-terminal domain-containing protein n=1 Tax=Fusarium oxysporum f. sp. melonis 26406 TaxID=1089452 RepID=W9ZTD3_FUSOX|nr:hypothetical protein FOMG_13180 [Fusarium oxysporum f. sp. melonis 26406]
MTGKALTDVACMVWDIANKVMTVKTYTAERKPNPDVKPDAITDWTPSEENVQVPMPMWDPTSPDAKMPDFLAPDLHGNGRSDLIIPYQNARGMLEFFLSQSNGAGLTAVQEVKQTNFPWVVKSKFMAMDITGTGVADVVQIFPNGQNLSFRNFPGVANESKSGSIGLADVIQTDTTCGFDNTIDWFLLKHSGTGAVSLVRVWQEVLPNDLYDIKATSFRCLVTGDSSKGFKATGIDSMLGGPFPKRDANAPVLSILSCDINGDGTQDIVLGKAEFQAPNMVFRYLVSLGDGMGSFAKCGDELTQTVENAMEPKGDGRFSVTNLNGGLYPSLAYVYQQSNDISFVCILTAEGKLSIVPVYNTGQPTDLLSSSNDSMGLVTAFSYGCLTDPDVYDSAVDWRNYPPTDPGNYVIKGAPNYAVTSLEHTNDSATNSLALEVNMAKTYRQVLVNSQGRGWLGFESITTHNIVDDIWTTEHYFQTFPKIGLKSKVDTLNSAPKVDPQQSPLSSQKTDYDTPLSQQNGCDIYHVNKLFDKLETEGEQCRVQMTQFTYDDNGNVITKYVSEHQQGQIIFQSWENCSYTSIRGITSLMTAMKLSSVETNRDLTANTALLETVKRWSDDTGDFLTTTHGFDDYGNEISTMDPAGLTTTTTYDSYFNSLPIQQVEKGRGVNSIQLLAYDMASGELLAKRETSGRLTCTRVDGFGRNIEARMQSKVTRTLSTTAKEFLPKVYAASSDFMKLLSDKCILDPVQQYSYDLFKSSAGNSYLTSSTLPYFNDTDIGQLQVLDVVDCVGQKRMQRSRQGVDPASSSTGKHVTWKCWTYDTRGNPLFESFNLQSAPWDNFEYQPGPSEGTTSVFDKLGRVLNKTRPSHNDSAINSVSSLQYSIGGGTVLETVTGPDPNASATNVVLWSAPRTYISINGKEHIISAANQGALTSEFTYDVAGNLLSASDPQAKRETRKYNSLGQLRILDNVYQRMQDPAKPPEQLAMTYIYNGTGQLEKTINANEEAIMLDRDSKGRPISKTGFDGRVLRYQYDDAGKERLSSMTVYPSGEAKQLETKLSFEYDERARLSSRALTLADGVEYEIVFEYDWQGQVMTKSYPNGATKLNKYIGSLLSYSEVYAEGPGGQRETWLDGTFEYNNATEKPNKITFGKADGQTDFQHTFEYDLQSYTLSHNLDQLGQSPSDTKPLVQKTYIYNGADQLAQNLDGMSNVAKKYNYEGKRLKNSQIGDANVKNYVYDSSGNILTKADTTISYGSNPATGKRGAATAFNILYDRAGRTTRRDTEASSLQLSYDSFGLLASYKDNVGKTTNMTGAPDGKTVKREIPGNGGSLLTISDDYNIQIKKDGSEIITIKLPKQASTHASGYSPSSAALFTDVKGNVTHRFKSTDGSLLKTITYDDFGTPRIKRVQPSDTSFDKTSTYESKSLDEGTELYDFGSRWYDPITGRFTTPDDILAVKDLARTDGLNRLVFENNDPINHADPSGHWSLSAVLGVVLGAALVVGAIALTIATGRAAAPLAAAAAGALASGGIAGGKFWGGYAATVLVNAAIGGATGALGAVATPANMVSATERLGQAVGLAMGTATENIIGAAATVGSKALISATSSLLTTVAHNAIENKFYGTHYSLFEGAGTAFGSGAAMGALGGLVSAGSHLVKGGESAVAQTSAQRLKKGLTGGGLLIGIRAGFAVAKSEDLPQRAGKWVSKERMEMANLYREQERNFKGLLSMVGPSGLVGTLHNGLIKHQSFVNYG